MFTNNNSNEFKSMPGDTLNGIRPLRGNHLSLASLGMTCSLKSAGIEYDFALRIRGRSMSKSRHTEAQIIGALKQLEAGRKAEDVAREVGVSKHTIYAWKAKYGGMDVSQAQEAKQLRDENTRLRKLVADLSLDKEALQSVIRKNGWSS
jgi:putative transposase